MWTGVACEKFSSLRTPTTSIRLGRPTAAPSCSHQVRAKPAHSGASRSPRRARKVRVAQGLVRYDETDRLLRRLDLLAVGVGDIIDERAREITARRRERTRRVDEACALVELRGQCAIGDACKLFPADAFDALPAFGNEIGELVENSAVDMDTPVPRVIGRSAD